MVARGGAGRAPPAERMSGKPSHHAALLQFPPHHDCDLREGPGPEHETTLAPARFHHGQSPLRSEGLSPTKRAKEITQEAEAHAVSRHFVEQILSPPTCGRRVLV